MAKRNYGPYWPGSADFNLNMNETNTIYSFFVTEEHSGPTLWVYVNDQQLDWFPCIGPDERTQSKLAAL